MCDLAISYELVTECVCRFQNQTVCEYNCIALLNKTDSSIVQLYEEHSFGDTLILISEIN